MKRFFQGLLGALGLVCLELFLVALWKRREFASVWEVELGSVWLLPSALVLALVASGVGVLLYALLERSPRAAERVALALLVGLAGTGVGYGVGGGRHLAEAGIRLLF